MASEWVSILVEDEDMRAYISQPETAAEVPGVVVIMEAFGVNKHIQDITDRLSREGYVVVAPVLYHRLASNPLFSYSGEDAEARTKAMEGLRDAELIQDLDATIAYLKGHAQVRGDRLGIVGFCVGGRISSLAATSCPGLSAAVVFYEGRILLPFGEGPAPIERTANIQCPVMGNFGDWIKVQHPTMYARSRRHCRSTAKCAISKSTLVRIMGSTVMNGQVTMPRRRGMPGRAHAVGSRSICRHR